MTERIVWTTSKAQLFRLIDYTSYAKSRNVKRERKKGKAGYQIHEKCVPGLGFEVHHHIVNSSSHMHVWQSFQCVSIVYFSRLLNSLPTRPNSCSTPSLASLSEYERPTTDSTDKQHWTDISHTCDIFSSKLEHCVPWCPRLTWPNW